MTGGPLEQEDGGTGMSRKGLAAGSVGLLGAIVIGVSCVAPAYTLTGALGPTASEVGAQVPAIFAVGFIPMLLVALGYPGMIEAADDVPTVLGHSPLAVEGMDRRLVDAVRRHKGPGAVPALPDGDGWLLCEVGGADETAEDSLARARALAGAAHTDAEKQALAEESPKMVGNLDGVEAKYRNIANRKLLNKDLQKYKPVADRLEQLKRANPGKSESQLLSRDELLQLKYYREAKNTESRSRRSAGWGTTLRRRRGKAIRARASRSGIIPFSAPATPGWAATAERSSWRESGIRATRRLRECRTSTSRSLATRTDRRRPVTPPRRHGPG